MPGVSAARKLSDDVTVYAKPNAGKPQLLDGRLVYKVSTEDFAVVAEQIHSAGVNIIGCCCGTGSEHIKALTKNCGANGSFPPKNLHFISRESAAVLLEYAIKRVSSKSAAKMIPIDAWKPVSADIELLKRCKQAIRQVVPDADVILYGSRARGDADEYSDYDILIIVNGSVDMALEERILDNIYPLELETCQVLTFIVYSQQDWDSPLYQAMPLHKNVDREGVIL